MIFINVLNVSLSNFVCSLKVKLCMKSYRLIDTLVVRIYVEKCILSIEAAYRYAGSGIRATSSLRPDILVEHLPLKF